MKKLLALILVLTLVLGMGVGVYADPVEPPTHVPIEKQFNLVNDVKGILSPEEVFSFTISPIAETVHGHDVPEFTPNTFDISFAEGGAGSPQTANIKLPNYEKVGIYTYELVENASNTAGVDYDGSELTLTVNVINSENGPIVESMFMSNGDNKVEGFVNTFSAGNLVITKTVEGNLGDKTKEFDITVTLNKPAEENINTVKVVYDGGKYENVPVTFTDNTAVLDLKIKHGDTIVIENLPYGVTYTVDEDDYSSEGYVATGEVLEPLAIGAVNDVVLLNTNETLVPTGINLDNLPYILILGAATLGLVGFTMKKRFNNR